MGCYACMGQPEIAVQFNPLEGFEICKKCFRKLKINRKYIVRQWEVKKTDDRRKRFRKKVR